MFAMSLFRQAGCELIFGSFETDGASGAINVVGNGFTVSYAATGLYTVTLVSGDPVYKEVVAFGAQLSGAIATVSTNGVIPTSNDADGTDTDGMSALFTTVNAAAAATAIDGPRVNFWIVARKTSATTDGSTF